MNTIARGNAAEAGVLQAFAAAGVDVLIPFGNGLPFDLGAVMWRSMRPALTMVVDDSTIGVARTC